MVKSYYGASLGIKVLNKWLVGLLQIVVLLVGNGANAQNFDRFRITVYKNCLEEKP